MKVDFGDDDVALIVVGTGAAMTYITHSLARKSITFYAESISAQQYIIHVDKEDDGWLDAVVREYAARNQL